MRILIYYAFILFIFTNIYPLTTIFYEDFDKPVWVSKDNAGNHFTDYIHNSVLEISSPDNSTTVEYWVKDIQLPEDKDYYLETMMTWQKGESKLYGICWDFQYDKDDDSYSYYFFGVGEDSYYLAHKKSNKGIKILENEKFPAINPGTNTTNKLTIYKCDDKFKFYINDLYATEIDYEDFDSPKLGLMIHCGQTVVADYFQGILGTYPFAGNQKNSEDITKSNSYSGYGILTYTNNFRYAGIFQDGKRNGKGTFYSTYGIYNGIWSNDSMVNGAMYYLGNQLYNGSPVYKYQGAWKYGQWNGEGSVFFYNAHPIHRFFNNGDIDYSPILIGPNNAWKIEISSDSLTPPDILYKLASENDYSILTAVAQNKSSDSKTLLKLISKGDNKIKILACLNENMYSSVADSIIKTIKFGESEKESSAGLLQTVFNKLKLYFIYSIPKKGTSSSNSVIYPTSLDLYKNNSITYSFSKAHLGKDTYLGTSSEGTLAYKQNTTWIDDYNYHVNLSLDKLIPARFEIRSENNESFYFPVFKNMGYDDIYGKRDFPLKIKTLEVFQLEKAFKIFEAIYNKRKEAGWDIIN